MTIATGPKGFSKETPAEALLRFQKAGLTLTNPIDLYWMVDLLKTQFYDKGDFHYPIKTICDGELIETSFYCPFEPRISPHYITLYKSREERSTLFAVPPKTTDMKKYNRINCEKVSALVVPDSSYDDTEIVALLYSMMYYINDQTAHCKLPEDEIQSELVDALNDNVLQYLSMFLDIFEPHDPQDMDRIWDFLGLYQPYFKQVDGKILLEDKYRDQPTPPQGRLIAKMTSYISERFGASKNITQIIYEVIRYIKGVKEEIKIRCDKGFTLTLKEYDEFRDQVTSSPMAHGLTDLTLDTFSYEVYKNPLFTELENLTSQIITYFNDVCTCDRERKDNDPFNSVFILKDLHHLNYKDACDLVIDKTMKKWARFLEIKQMLLDQAANESDKTSMADMIQTRENSLIGYVLHEVCCVTEGYARDHKPLLKAYLEKTITTKLEMEVAQV